MHGAGLTRPGWKPPLQQVLKISLDATESYQEPVSRQACVGKGMAGYRSR